MLHPEYRTIRIGDMDVDVREELSAESRCNSGGELRRTDGRSKCQTR